MRIDVGVSKWTWGLLLLLAAALIIANQIGSFAEFGVGSIVVGMICLAIIVQCLFGRSFAVIPFPLGALYFVFQGHFGWPHIGFWILLAASALASVGLAVLLPKKAVFLKKSGVGRKYSSKYVYDDNYESEKTKSKVTSDDDDKNFDISLEFGSMSRYLRSDSLESVRLNCKLGALEVYFDDVQLSPNGAEVFLDCNLGAIELYIPKHWNVTEDIDCTLGGVDSKRKRNEPSADSPELIIRGNVSLGGVDIHYV